MFWSFPTSIAARHLIFLGNARTEWKSYGDQNGLADGRIAANWEEVLVAQHRRLLSEKGSDSYPVTDLRLRDPPQAHRGIRIIMTNSWRLRINRDDAAKRNVIDDRYRQIIERQAKNISCSDGVTDCLNYIRELWRNDIQSKIAAWRQRRDFLLWFEQFEKSIDDDQLASLRIPEPHNMASLGVIDDVTRGLDGEAVLSTWSDLLEKDLMGSCASLRIRTALEAELLFTWCKGERCNANKFRKCFGRSRQNDIDHVSTFVPYVDALTTDNDMYNLCKRQIVDSEIKRFPCKMFSKKNYGEFEKWLDELLAEANTSNSNRDDAST